MAPFQIKGPRCLGPNVYPEAPDGGWGWVIAVAFFMVEIFTYGTIKIFGIFLQNLMEEFGESNSRVSWIVSISVFVMAFNAPLSAVMTNRFGFQLVVMLGGFLISLGTITTSFTSSVNQMYITYGLIAGMGYCLTFLPTVTILSQYFSRRRSLVTAVASSGEALSIFALAPAFSALKSHVGWRRTMAVIGALQGTIMICGALLRPIVIKPRATQKEETDASSPKELEALGTQDTNPENNTSNEQMTSYSQENDLTRGSVSTGDSGVQSLKDAEHNSQEEKTLLYKEETWSSVGGERESEEKYSQDAEKQLVNDEQKPCDAKTAFKTTKLLDFSILKECSFIFYSLFGLFATLGFFAPQLYVIELSVSRGVERDQATYMLSTMAVTEIFGRLIIGWILTRKRLRTNKLRVLLVCVIAITVDLLGFTLVTEFYGLAACCAVYGFFLGTLTSTHIPMLAEDDVVGIERMSSAAGVYVFIQSFAGLAGPPLGGMLVDVTQNYGSAFYSCAAGMAISALFLGLVRPAKRGLLCGKRSSECPEDKHEQKNDSGEKVEANTSDKRQDSSEHCTEVDDISIHNQEEATKDDQEVISFA